MHSIQLVAFGRYGIEYSDLLTIRPKNQFFVSKFVICQHRLKLGFQFCLRIHEVHLVFIHLIRDSI